MPEVDYSHRPLTEGFPNLEAQAVSHFAGGDPISRVGEIVSCLARLVDLSSGCRSIAVVGCGPNPQSVKDLLSAGFDAVGIEPVEGYARRAAESLGSRGEIKVGTAEVMPLESASQRAVLLESVLEHVDSPAQALAEAYRVLVPGGVLYVYTTNRLRFSLRGENGEFNVPFFNWFPSLVRESYVYKHLHFAPALANYSLRPAVHWFTYADLCRRGREVGFAQFYSLIDLVDAEAPSLKRGRFRRFLVQRCRHNPWLRALGLTQFGSAIFMYKRP